MTFQKMYLIPVEALGKFKLNSEIEKISGELEALKKSKIKNKLLKKIKYREKHAQFLKAVKADEVKNDSPVGEQSLTARRINEELPDEMREVAKAVFDFLAEKSVVGDKNTVLSGKIIRSNLLDLVLQSLSPLRKEPLHTDFDIFSTLLRKLGINRDLIKNSAYLNAYDYGPGSGEAKNVVEKSVANFKRKIGPKIIGKRVRVPAAENEKEEMETVINLKRKIDEPLMKDKRMRVPRAPVERKPTARTNRVVPPVITRKRKNLERVRAPNLFKIPKLDERFYRKRPGSPISKIKLKKIKLPNPPIKREVQIKREQSGSGWLKFRFN